MTRTVRTEAQVASGSGKHPCTVAPMDDTSAPMDDSARPAHLLGASTVLPVTELHLGVGGIVVTVTGDPASPAGAVLRSALHEPEDSTSGGEPDPFEASLSGIEALVLAHAASGVDVCAPAYVEGVASAIDAVTNQLG